MTDRSETVAALVAALDKNERAALLWAARLGAAACDWAVPGSDVAEAMATGRTLRALFPILRDAAWADDAPAAGPLPPPSAGPRVWGEATDVQRGPTPCSNCDTSIALCDARIRGGKTACCAECAVTDTHGDTPSGFAERERARAAVIAGTVPAPATDGKAVADRSISRGTLRPRGV